MEQDVEVYDCYNGNSDEESLQSAKTKKLSMPLCVGGGEVSFVTADGDSTDETQSRCIRTAEQIRY